MKSLFVLAVTSLLTSVALSCGAAPETGAPTAPALEPLEEIHAEPADPDPEPGARFAVLGSAADVDVTLEAGDVILRTETRRMRFSGGAWKAEAEAEAPRDDATSLPWIRGAKLRASTASDASFVFEGGDAPDMSALVDKPFVGSYPQVAFATHAASGHFYALAINDHGDLGTFEWTKANGATFTKLPVAKVPYAIYPVAVIARSPRDVWAFASTTSGDAFGPDFPGCPISVFHSQDGGYVAHFDGRRWTEIAWPGSEHIESAELQPDGAITVTAGWSEDSQAAMLVTSPPTPQEHWRLAPDGTFARSTGLLEARARALGWTLEGGSVRDHGAIAALPTDEHYVPVRIVAVTERDVFVYAKVLSGADDTGERVWLRSR